VRLIINQDRDSPIGIVTGEPTTEHGEVVSAVPERGTSAVQGNEPSATTNGIEEGFYVLRVRVDERRPVDDDVERCEAARTKDRQITSDSEVEASLAGDDAGKLTVVGRPVMEPVPTH
jgi:hypothetical protein